MDLTPSMAAAARRIPPERPASAAKVERMKQRLRENLSRNLLRLRAERQWSQRQLSEKSDISQTYISQLETLAARPPRGAGAKVDEKTQGRAVSLDLIAALAVALDVTPADLISD
jgi:transcriptional regulator with XRE-family HTH domain